MSIWPLLLFAVSSQWETVIRRRRSVRGHYHLREYGIKLAVLDRSNGLVWQQREKIEICGVRDLDRLPGRFRGGRCEETGARIFDIALVRLGARSEETIVFGDSWPLDVLGARVAGPCAVWLNRYGEACPEPGSVVEITSLEPVERLLGILAE
jgi:hypothetical protein